MGGKTLKGILWGRLGRPRWAKWGPPRAGAPALAEPGMWDSPTLPGWQGWLPLGAYIRKGTPGLLIHQLILLFLLDFVIPFVGVAPRMMRGSLHHIPLSRCWCSGPSLPLLVLDWSFVGRRFHRTCVTPYEVLR